MYNFDVPDEFNSFIDKYADIIKRNETAVFVETGYSSDLGYPDWAAQLYAPMNELEIER